LDEKISGSVMFLTTAKEIRDTLKVMYGNEKNLSRVFEIYKRMFELKQEDKSVVNFYGELKGLIDELEMHQPIITDAVTLRGYRQDLAVLKYLSGLSPTLISQVRGHILGGDSILTLTITFSRVLRVSTRTDVSSTSFIDLPCTLDVVQVWAAAMALEDVAYLARDVIFLVADRVLLIRGPDTLSTEDG